MSEVLDQILERFLALPAETRAELEKIAKDHAQAMPWVPTVGPQFEAYNSKADILLYGGAAGGGKTDLGLGLAFTAHKNTLALRRQYTDLSAITARAIQINRTRKGFNGSIPPKLKTGDGRLIEFGAVQRLGDEESWQGRPHDLIFFDEGVQFIESQVRFLIGWNRSVDPKQRCRIVLASNPPIGADGEWIISFFGPWLDPVHPDPAKPGELRWYVTDSESKDLAVQGPAPVMVDGKLTKPMSRTFIPAMLKDNPWLTATEAYAAKLDSMQEPYRSAFRDGNFMLARKDALQQVIPTAWVRDAQARWSPVPMAGVPMCAIGVDCSGGGEDPMIIAPRHDGWFAPLVEIAGKDIPMDRSGTFCAGQIISYRRDGAHVILDMGGGYGGPAYEHLKANLPDATTGPVVHGHKGAETSMARTADNQLGFYNKRSEVYWKFREALDPEQVGGSPVALPPDPRMVSDLTAPTFEVTPRGIKVEPKEDVVAKLRRSPDRGDAVVISWSQGQKAMTHALIWNKAHNNVIRTPNVIRHRAQQREFVRR